MPNPTVTDVHIDAALSQFSIAYRNETYIGDQVFPRVGVNKRSDFYFVFDRASWFRDDVAIRAPGTRAARADYQVQSASYVCVNYALAKSVPDEVRDNADNPLRPDAEATEFVTDALLRAQEIRVADIVMTNGNWTYGASPTTQWSSDTSDPLGDIELARTNVVTNIGRLPNTGVMSWDVWSYLRNHPDLLDRIKHTRPGGVPMVDDIATMFGLDRVLVGTSIKDTALEGQSASHAFIWGDDFWLGYVTPNAALMTPSAGYLLEWGARTVRRYREDQEHADVIESMHYMDEVISASEAGALIYDAV